MNAKPESGIRMDLPELMGIMVLIGGLHMLLLRQIGTGSVALTIGAGLIAISSRGIPGLPKTAVSTSYSSWVAREAAASYEKASLTSAGVTFERNEETRALIRQLGVELPEMFLIDVVAGMTHVDTLAILRSATSDSAPNEVEIDGRLYRPRKALARILLAIAQEDRYREVPARDWLMQSRKWALEPVKTENTRT